jgi:hypothetical protein
MGRGSLILKRKFRGAPCFRRATGTDDPKVVEQIDLMLRAFYTQARFDYLEALCDGRLHPLATLAQWRRGREISMPPAELAHGLEDAWRAWERSVAGSDHRSSIGTTRRALRIPRTARIDALPDLLAAMVRHNRGKTRTVNLARNHVRAFLRDTVGVSHDLYAKVRDMRPEKKKPRARGTPHSPGLLLDLVPKMNELQTHCGDMMWTMAATGMGNREYWYDGFEALEDRVLIHGKKRAGRERVVMRWSDRDLTQPACWEGRLRDVLRRASGGAVMVYDLRRSFARWCEEAHIIASNIEAYLGHGPKTMLALYTRGQLPGQLAADAEKMRAYVASATGGH